MFAMMDGGVEAGRVLLVYPSGKWEKKHPQKAANPEYVWREKRTIFQLLLLSRMVFLARARVSLWCCYADDNSARIFGEPSRPIFMDR